MSSAHQMYRTKRLGVLMPNRLGDSILSVPFCLTLQALLADQGASVTYLVKSAFYPVYSYTDELRVIPSSLWKKAKSWFQPFSTLLHCANSSDYWGYRAQQHWGQPVPSKPYHHYDQALSFLEVDGAVEHLSPSLRQALEADFALGLAPARYFGLLLSLGFSEQVILETADQLRQSTAFPRITLPTKPDSPSEKGYITLGLEAGYQSARSESRRWSVEQYFEFAKQIYEQYGWPSYVVGLNSEPSLPDCPYLVDKRSSTQGLGDVMTILQGAKAHVGNDSGLLHLANLLDVPTVGLYLTTDPGVYGPLERSIHHSVVKPSTIKELMQAFQQLRPCLPFKQVISA